jgi:hypothetical protein
MNRLCLGLLLFLLSPALLLAQRYGRPYSIAENPQVLLQIRIDKDHRYLRVSDLRKMPRTVITQTDPATHFQHTYEGVALDQLISPQVLATPRGRIAIESDSHHTVTLSFSDLAADPKPMIVDTIDGKPVPGDAPYYFLAKGRQQPLQTITIASVDCITVALQ